MVSGAQEVGRPRQSGKGSRPLGIGKGVLGERRGVGSGGTSLGARRSMYWASRPSFRGHPFQLLSLDHLFSFLCPREVKFHFSIPTLGGVFLFGFFGMKTVQSTQLRAALLGRSCSLIDFSNPAAPPPRPPPPIEV